MQSLNAGCWNITHQKLNKFGGKQDFFYYYYFKAVKPGKFTANLLCSKFNSLQ